MANYTYHVRILGPAKTKIPEIIEREPQTKRYFKAALADLQETGGGTPADSNDYRFRVEGTDYYLVLDTSTERTLKVKEIEVKDVE
jgi:hypothetical protein